MGKFMIRKGYDKDEALLREIKAAGLPVVLYGVGLIADTAREFLKEQGICVASHVIDDKYTDTIALAPGQGRLLSISELQNEYPSYVLLLCFFGGYRDDLAKYHALFPGAVIVDFLSSIYDRGALETLDIDYVNANTNAYSTVCDLLEDPLSKDSMLAYMHAKIYRDARYLFPYVRRPQYFTQDGAGADLKLGRDEIFVNCGAYTGDTIKDFLKVTGGGFRSIYACEPDSENLEKLTECIHNAGIADRTRIVPVCISDKRETVYFLNQGTMLSRKVDEPQPGVVSVQADTLDNILQGLPATMIVMDVEGNELRALQGARTTILTYKPLLAVAAYHKKDDLPLLVQYLKQLVPDYRFYFRVHKPMAIDAVLYASARERGALHPPLRFQKKTD